MGKRIIISEEEKKHIKGLYQINEEENLNEGIWFVDLYDFIKDKGGKAVDFLKKVTGSGEGSSKETFIDKIKNLTSSEREELEKEVGYEKKTTSDKKRTIDKKEVETSFDVESSPDKDFYKKILNGIDAPYTDENFKFLYAWRKAEGGKAKNNPFNTTQKMKDDPRSTDYNKVGVKNYSNKNIGIEATIKTLLNGRYPCILKGLKNDAGAEKIASCSSDLKTWGTGNLITTVLKTKKFTPPRIEK